MKNIKDINFLVNWSKERGIKCHIIGAGSNILINDYGLKGLTISTKKLQGSKINEDNGIVEALAGEPLPTLSRKVARCGLHGMEWAVGIPGTVGGAVVMNAGAQGSCIEEILDSIQVISLKEGKTFRLTNKDLKFSYRNSLLQEKDLIVLSARFILEPGYDKKLLNEITTNNLEKRLKSQPYHLPSCGSIFKNPESLKAGEMIEKTGLKGYRIGGAEVSTLHANFIVNANHAKAIDIHKLILVIQKKVKASYGLLLHPEVKQLGFE